MQKVYVLSFRADIAVEVLGVYKYHDEAWDGAAKHIEGIADIEHLKECYPDRYFSENKFSLEALAHIWHEYTEGEEEFFVEEYSVIGS